MTVKEFIIKNKLKLRDIADATHFSQSHISRLTRGEKVNTEEFNKAFEKAYGFIPEPELPPMEKARQLLDEKDAEIERLKNQIQTPMSTAAPLVKLLSSVIDKKLQSLKNEILFKLLNNENIFNSDVIDDTIKEVLDIERSTTLCLK